MIKNNIIELKNKKIGVVGTLSTIKSNAYTKIFNQLGDDYLIKEVAS